MKQRHHLMWFDDINKARNAKAEAIAGEEGAAYPEYQIRRKSGPRFELVQRVIINSEKAPERVKRYGAKRKRSRH